MTQRHSLSILLSVSIVAIVLAGLAQAAFTSDWPAYRRDPRRSAVSTDRLEFPLNVAWHRTASHPPAPAFADPLRHPTEVDFTQVRDFSQPVQLNFDHAFHPVAADGRVFFGSSANDSVRCVSLTTGRQEWVFVTGGPVRFAPQVVGDRLYVASDDGLVYCLSARSGDIVWKFRAAPSTRQVVGNGRIISRWPLRSGVLVVDGVLYVTAGMWPSEGVFVYALDADTGLVKWVNDTSGTVNLPTTNLGAYAIGGVAPTGYLLAGNKALVVPTGRSMPATYSLDDGKLIKSFAPSYQNKRGGPVRCIDPHGSVVFGYPRERLTQTEYSIHYIYQLPNLQQYGTIRADRLLADERTYLVVNDLIRCATFNPRYTSSRLVVHWQVGCPSKSVHCMALAGKSLLLGVDNRVVARDRETGRVLWQHNGLDGLVLSLAIADGQLVVATDVGSIYCFRSGSQPISERTASTAVAVSSGHLHKSVKPLEARLLDVLENERIRRGLALVTGHRDTRLAEQLAAASHLQVVLLLDDADNVMKARRQLLQNTDSQRQDTDRGQVSVQLDIGQDLLPFSDYAFNIIVSTSDAAMMRSAEIHRVLRPAGGILFVDQATANVTNVIKESFGHDSSKPAVDVWQDGDSTIARRGKLPGALDWDSETDRDQRVKWPLELLWFGGPGSKRTGSGSRPPVAAGGRNLVIGKNHLVALDAYNGTELWSRTLPYLYRNIGRLRKAPGPISPWLASSVNADDDHVWLNFGHVVYRLDAATGKQEAVYGELPEAETFLLKDQPHFLLDHYQQPNERGTSAVPTKVPKAAGSIRLVESQDAKDLKVILQLDTNIEVSDSLYWELFFDVRSPERRAHLYEKGIFHLLVRPATGSVETGVGPDHPHVSVNVEEDGRRTVLTISSGELASLTATPMNSFSFAAALNHKATADQKAMAGGRAYLRWEYHADAFATAFNNGWPVIHRDEKAATHPASLLPIGELPEQALRTGRIGGIGRKAGYVVNVGRERENPLSQEISAFEYNRGKGCGNPVASGSLHVLRAGSLAFYDLDDDSGMRYFGGVRPGCTISAVPAQGLVFASEASSGCDCNYNFKTTLALAPAKQRHHEDWAMFAAPLSPAALLQTGRFNLGAPGDRRDDRGGLWLQFPRAPTRSNRTMPVPVELFGETLDYYRVNADRVAISGTDRPWLYASGIEGVEKFRLQLFMSDNEGIVVFPGKPPVLDAVLEEKAWERRYGVTAGTGCSMFLSHDKEAIYVGYEVIPPLDRRGKRAPWKTRSTLPYSTQFSSDDQADDAAVWEEDSLEFLVSDTTLKTILHFGIGVTGGRYDGLWSATRKTQVADYSPRWSGAADVSVDKATAEFALPWKTLSDAGLDLDSLIIRPRSRKPIVRQPHITHGFRPMLVQSDQPDTKQYRVVLHFAELNDVAVGERVFDVELQGKTVLKNFDPVAAGGAQNCAVVRTFSGIQADRALELRLIRRAVSDADDAGLPPILSALELSLDR